MTSIEDAHPEIYANDEPENIAYYVNMNVDVLKFDCFEPGVLTKIEFNYEEDVDPWTLIECSDRCLSCDVYGFGEVRTEVMNRKQQNIERAGRHSCQQ